MIQLNYPTLMSASFPRSQTGKLGSVYYTVKKSDGTTLLTRRNTGVQEYGLGNYGVIITFTTVGSYVVLWDIQGTIYSASDEVVVHDFKTTEIGVMYADWNTVTASIELIKQMETGRWKIDPATHEMIFYQEDNITEIVRFQLKDVSGNNAHINVFERVKL